MLRKFDAVIILRFSLKSNNVNKQKTRLNGFRRKPCFEPIFYKYSESAGGKNKFRARQETTLPRFWILFSEKYFKKWQQKQ